MSDLKGKAGQLVVGGPPELKARPAGLPGLKKVYGIEDFKEFKALDAGGPLTASALSKGDIDVGRVFATQGIIADEGWVVLEEDKPPAGPERRAHRAQGRHDRPGPPRP